MRPQHDTYRHWVVRAVIYKFRLVSFIRVCVHDSLEIRQLKVVVFDNCTTKNGTQLHWITSQYHLSIVYQQQYVRKY